MSKPRPGQYVFSIPNLDRQTYGRLKTLRERNGLSQHGLITLAINLLHEVLDDQGRAHQAVLIELVRDLQIEFGIRRLT